VTDNNASLMGASIRSLLRAFTIDEARYPPAEGKIRYNGPEFQTLYFVGLHPDCSSAALATFLGVSPTTAQSVIERLIKRGLILRRRSDGDKRAVALTLTQEGEAMRAAINRQDRRNCETMLAALPEAERSAFVAQMAQIAQAIERNSG
jgi:DNA-binding MarR family transcriptional regulator